MRSSARCAQGIRWPRPGVGAALAALLLGGVASSAAMASGAPSTYPGCASRSVSVAKGGSVRINLSDCHSFGLGIVARAPTQGTATPGDSAPVDSYVYTHGGGDIAPGGSDSFVILDDNSDLITVRVALQGGTSALVPAPATLPPLAVGRPFEQRLSTGGGIAPYGYGVASGSLPPGLALSREGMLAGKPTRRGPFQFSVRITDARGATADKAYGGVVDAGTLSLTPRGIDILPGQAFSQALSASGGVAPYRFALEPGPASMDGVRVTREGLLSGSLDVPPGNYPVRVRVTDGSAGTGEHFEIHTVTLAVADGATPAVSVAVSPAAVAEDEHTAMRFTVTRSARLATATTVKLAWSGSAKTRARSALVIPAGETSATITLYPVADHTPEPDETLVLTIAPGAGYAPGAAPSASIIIVNDDLP